MENTVADYPSLQSGSKTFENPEQSKEDERDLG